MELIYLARKKRFVLDLYCAHYSNGLSFYCQTSDKARFIKCILFLIYFNFIEKKVWCRHRKQCHHLIRMADSLRHFFFFFKIYTMSSVTTVKLKIGRSCELVNSSSSPPTPQRTCTTRFYISSTGSKSSMFSMTRSISNSERMRHNLASMTGCSRGLFSVKILTLR